ncbi:MAG: FtsX-like permease family protein [candidate division Zixibacteria bacterium]|nr:FtsX-like permease family protein [candidate division Zixibacteria bacterium]
MWVLRLILRNTARHKLRTLLTILGLALAIVAFQVIQTTLQTWNAQLEASSPRRLITRHAVSYTFSLPLAYYDKISRLPGISKVGYANWFGGIYNNDPKNFFAQFPMGPEHILDIYPELIIPQEQKEQYLADKSACIAGQKLVDRFGWKIGDVIRLTSQIYPGQWDFVLKAIYKGRDPAVDENGMYFHWDYFDDKVRQISEGWAGNVGWYIVEINDPKDAAMVSAEIDALFKNSPQQTLTETEKAFSAGFIAGFDTIIAGMKIISFLIIGVILLVLANNMIMGARERVNEFALLKTLGFRPFHIFGLLFGESFAIAIIGGIVGVILSYFAISFMAIALAAFFSSIFIAAKTIIYSILLAMLVGLLASLLPIYRTIKTSIVDGLRNIG